MIVTIIASATVDMETPIVIWESENPNSFQGMDKKSSSKLLSPEKMLDDRRYLGYSSDSRKTCLQFCFLWITLIATQKIEKIFFCFINYNIQITATRLENHPELQGPILSASSSLCVIKD